MIRKTIFIIVLGLFFSSCTHKIIKTDIEKPISSLQGIVLDDVVLSNGGNFALTPFKAGPLAEASEEADKISMMILKGIKEQLESHSTVLKIVNTDINEQPKIALEGFIDEYSKTGRISQMMLKPNRVKLALSGDIWLISNGHRLLKFSIESNFDPKIYKVPEIAYEMGKEIGYYITQKTKVKE